MDSNEILRRSQKSGEDEGKDFVNQKADRYGFIAMCIAIFVLGLYKNAKDLPFGDVLSLSFIFLSVGMFARYRADGERFNLIFGIVTGVTAIAALSSYIIFTW